MHIVACVKQTPKSDNVKVDPQTGCLIRSVNLGGGKYP